MPATVSAVYGRLSITLNTWSTVGLSRLIGTDMFAPNDEVTMVIDNSVFVYTFKGNIQNTVANGNDPAAGALSGGLFDGGRLAIVRVKCTNRAPSTQARPAPPTNRLATVVGILSGVGSSIGANVTTVVTVGTGTPSDQLDVDIYEG